MLPQTKNAVIAYLATCVVFAIVEWGTLLASMDFWFTVLALFAVGLQLGGGGLFGPIFENNAFITKNAIITQAISNLSKTFFYVAINNLRAEYESLETVFTYLVWFCFCYLVITPVQTFHLLKKENPQTISWYILISYLITYILFYITVCGLPVGTKEHWLFMLAAFTVAFNFGNTRILFTTRLNLIIREVFANLLTILLAVSVKIVHAEGELSEKHFAILTTIYNNNFIGITLAMVAYCCFEYADSLKDGNA